MDAGFGSGLDLIPIPYLLSIGTPRTSRNSQYVQERGYSSVICRFLTPNTVYSWNLVKCLSEGCVDSLTIRLEDWYRELVSRIGIEDWYRGLVGSV